MSGMDAESDDELEELEGDALWDSLEAEMAQEAEDLQNLDAALYQNLMRSILSKEWKKAEES